MGMLRVYLEALFVPAGWQVRVFGLFGILYIPSEIMSIWNITLSGCMGSLSNYTFSPQV